MTINTISLVDSREDVGELLLDHWARYGFALLTGSPESAGLRHDALSLATRIHGLPASEQASLEGRQRSSTRGFFFPENLVASDTNTVESMPEQHNRPLQTRKYCAFECGRPGWIPQTWEYKVLGLPNIMPNDVLLMTDIEALFLEFEKLANSLLPRLSSALTGDSNFLGDASQDSASQMRLIHYPPASPGDELLGAHTDYELFTLIVQGISGLQVKSRDGNWRDAFCECAITCLPGDAMEVLSNGIITSSLHRVAASSVDRHSAVFFCGLDPRTIIRPCARFGEPCYEPICFGEHLVARMLENYPFITPLVDPELVKRLDTGRGNPFKRGK